MRVKFYGILRKTVRRRDDTHLELAEIPLDLSEHVVPAEILVVDLRASTHDRRDDTVTLIFNSLLIGLSILNVKVSFHSGFRVPLIVLVCCASQPEISMYAYLRKRRGYAVVAVAA